MEKGATLTIFPRNTDTKKDIIICRWGHLQGTQGHTYFLNCSYTSAQQVDLLYNYTNVMFALDPLEQLVSAHRDKLLHYEPFCSVILANKRGATLRENNNSTEKVCFQEVVNFI
ncbi:gamma-aminobutyric acid receptor subunit beta-1-like [Platysternon megacephalum]|uniref:Gamma-aminobutyric acid receptor subunit beta-1-like n=1 Tax=Platysternon megacephalum TaxID=55544 RepID=A0A4D9FB57_9SAUR|nr:gamma-aminobutyric acid receptor subunit beta-1-like [Platysternon megacephalum]